MKNLVKHLGKTSFIQKYPVVFAIIVTVGVETVMWALGYYDTGHLLSTEPLKTVFAWILKFSVMLALIYAFLYFMKKRNSGNLTDTRT